MRHRSFFLLVAVFGLVSHAAAQNTEFLPGMEWEAPPVVDPGPTSASPPSDAIVLFDGTDASAWENGENWTVKDGVLYAGSGYITTKQHFGDLQLHLEWSAPDEVSGQGQGRGNSGVFLMGKYEVQVLDNFNNATYPEGQAGAVYKQTAPMANAMRSPTEWNTYDILWTCPRFNSSSQLVEPAYVTVIHNGVVLLNHFELRGDTPWARPPRYVDIGPKGPIALQDHGNPVAFRNIWVRELKPAVGERREPRFKDHESGETWTLIEEADGRVQE